MLDLLSLEEQPDGELYHGAEDEEDGDEDKVGDRGQAGGHGGLSLRERFT